MTDFSYVPAASKPPRRECFRVDSQFLVEIGWLETLPANNAPWFTFGPINPDKLEAGVQTCDHWIEMQYRDGDQTWCPLCATDNQHCRLTRKILQAPSMPQVWHEHYNPAADRLISDRKQLDNHFRDETARKVERLTGTPANFVRTDLREHRDHLANVQGRDMEIGLKEQHDRAVKDGHKEATGKTVHTLNDRT